MQAQFKNTYSGKPQEIRTRDAFAVPAAAIVAASVMAESRPGENRGLAVVFIDPDGRHVWATDGHGMAVITLSHSVGDLGGETVKIKADARLIRELKEVAKYEGNATVYTRSGTVKAGDVRFSDALSTFKYVPNWRNVQPKGSPTVDWDGKVGFNFTLMERIKKSAQYLFMGRNKVTVKPRCPASDTSPWRFEVQIDKYGTKPGIYAAHYLAVPIKLY